MSNSADCVHTFKSKSVFRTILTLKTIYLVPKNEINKINKNSWVPHTTFFANIRIAQACCIHTVIDFSIALNLSIWCVDDWILSDTNVNEQRVAQHKPHPSHRGRSAITGKAPHYFEQFTSPVPVRDGVYATESPENVAVTVTAFAEGRLHVTL